MSESEPTERGFLAGAKDKLEDLVDDVKAEFADGGRADAVLDKARDRMDDLKEAVSDKVDDVKAEFADGGRADAVLDKARDRLSDAKEAVSDKVDDLKDRFDGDDETPQV